MKNAVLLMGFVATILFFYSCSNENAKSKTTSSNPIDGTWELKRAQYGMIPAKDYPAGNGNRYVFSDNTYEKYTDGTLSKKGSYELVSDTTVSAEVGLEIPAGQFTQRIIFDKDTTSPKTFIDLSGNKLVFISGSFPVDSGSRETYEKQ